MKRSTQRVLTTHTGSLPRPADVVELLLHEQEHPGTEAAKLKDAVRRAVAEVVAKQVACGLDVINDGEQGRTDYTTHVKDRLSGFDRLSNEIGGDEDAAMKAIAIDELKVKFSSQLGAESLDANFFAGLSQSRLDGGLTGFYSPDRTVDLSRAQSALLADEQDVSLAHHKKQCRKLLRLPVRPVKLHQAKSLASGEEKDKCRGEYEMSESWSEVNGRKLLSDSKNSSPIQMSRIVHTTGPITL